MMKRLITPILILFVIALQFISCEGLDEDYATNPNLRLSFSVDTLSFDTVFTNIGSATKSFMIYNHNDKPLLISNILLISERFHFVYVKRYQTSGSHGSLWTKCKFTQGRHHADARYDFHCRQTFFDL